MTDTTMSSVSPLDGIDDGDPAGAQGEGESAGTSVPHVVGIDMSLTSTGLACNHDTTTIRTTGHKGDSITERSWRLRQIAGEILAWAAKADLVVIEGPAFTSQHGSMHDRSGLWWLVVDRLVRGEIPLAVMPPANLKKYATGAGNAKKDAVMLAIARRFPMFTVTGNDIADAIGLMAAGLDHLGCPLVILPDAHRKALAPIDWPEMRAR